MNFRGSAYSEHSSLICVAETMDISRFVTLNWILELVEWVMLNLQQTRVVFWRQNDYYID